jgi:hypothetical protein
MRSARPVAASSPWRGENTDSLAKLRRHEMGATSGSCGRGQASPPPSAARSVFVKNENRAALSSPLKGEEEQNRHLVHAARSPSANAGHRAGENSAAAHSPYERLPCPQWGRDGKPSVSREPSKIVRATGLPTRRGAIAYELATGTKYRVFSSSPSRGEDSAARFSLSAKIDLAALGGGDFARRVRPTDGHSHLATASFREAVIERRRGRADAG